MDKWNYRMDNITLAEPRKQRDRAQARQGQDRVWGTIGFQLEVASVRPRRDRSVPPPSFAFPSERSVVFSNCIISSHLYALI